MITRNNCDKTIIALANCSVSSDVYEVSVVIRPTWRGVESGGALRSIYEPKNVGRYARSMKEPSSM